MVIILADDETSISTLREAVKSFISERSWEKYHNPKDIAESICVEAAELLRLFQWITPKESEDFKKDKAKIQRIKEELSDVIIYCLSMANAIDVDLSDAILEKLEQNKSKYPTDLYKGRAYLDY
jgi:dCTP diphosphatase